MVACIEAEPGQPAKVTYHPVPPAKEKDEPVPQPFYEGDVVRFSEVLSTARGCKSQPRGVGARYGWAVRSGGYNARQ